jgi:hypothetical protein
VVEGSVALADIITQCTAPAAPRAPRTYCQEGATVGGAVVERVLEGDEVQAPAAERLRRKRRVRSRSAKISV